MITKKEFLELAKILPLIKEETAEICWQWNANK